jgi:hypothetical protein
MTISSQNIAENDAKFQIISLKGIFNKSADILARAAVTNAVKITAVSTLAGIGASAFLTTGATVLAAGIGAGLYSFGKDSLTAYRESRAAKTDFHLLDTARLNRARNALLCGVAGGAFGSWLAGTDTFQEGVSLFKEYGMKAAGWLGDFILPVAAASAALPLLPMEAPKLNLMQRLQDIVHHAKPSHSRLFNEVAKIDTAHPKKFSAQFLKDRANEVLRLKGVSWEERATLARDLAVEAKAHGNRQAEKFLSDLEKLNKWHAKPSLVSASAPAAITAETSPSTGTPERPLLVRFREAATCILGDRNAEGVFAVQCTPHLDTMQGGDTIVFQQGEYKTSVMLAPGSDAVATKDFMHRNAITRGVRDLLKLKITNPI